VFSNHLDDKGKPNKNEVLRLTASEAAVKAEGAIEIGSAIKKRKTN
jgi:hypothetical protein